jgi:uncharacterized protein (TIGR03437 family)
MWKAIGLLVLIPALGLGQRPEVYPGGVVNAATLAPLGQWHFLAPGSIFTVFGRSLATTTESARSVPLPTKLGGAEVLVSGRPVPLFYASPTQINAQMPHSVIWENQEVAYPPLVVRTAAGESDAVPLRIWWVGLGIFTLDASGCGPGTVFNVGPDGSLSLNSPDNPVPPGGVLTIFGTGFGPTSPLELDGQPAPFEPLLSWFVHGAPVVDYPSVPSSTGAPGRVLYAGRAPGLIGVDQMNLQLRESVVQGCGVPLRLTSDSSQSQPVPISVGRGGTCPPLPAPDAFGAVTLRRVETLSATSTAVNEELVVDLASAVNKRPPPDPYPPVGQSRTSLTEYTSVPRGPACPGFETFYDRPLDAGVITLSGPGLDPMRFAPAWEGGRPVYRGALPLGTMRPGEFVVSAAGGADVGAFQVAIRVPPLIEVTTERPTNGSVDPSRYLRVTWRGGDLDSVVRVRLISRTSPFEDVYYEAAVRASAGSATLYPTSSGLGLPWFSNAELRISMAPEGEQVQRFTAKGLSLGGQFTWLYQKRFTELKLQ